MQHNCDTLRTAESLLSVTVAASAAVQSGDWETAGQLLRRREQLLTKLENCDDLEKANGVLLDVQKAERSLMGYMEQATRSAIDGLQELRAARSARKLYQPSAPPDSRVERAG